MLVAFVSDERYVALPDVILEFEGKDGSFEARSRDRLGSCRSSHRHVRGYAAKARIRGQEGAGRDRSRAAAVSLSPALGLPARLRMAQVGQGERDVRVPGAFGRAVSPESLAVWLQERARPRPRLV